jgi:hypothetical protein
LAMCLSAGEPLYKLFPRMGRPLHLYNHSSSLDHSSRPFFLDYPVPLGHIVPLLNNLDQLHFLPFCAAPEPRFSPRHISVGFILSLGLVNVTFTCCPQDWKTTCFCLPVNPQHLLKCRWSKAFYPSSHGDKLHAYLGAMTGSIRAKLVRGDALMLRHPQPM